VAKTKFFVIGAVMSVPRFDVVDHVAGIQFVFTVQPAMFPGCGPAMTSTLFWASSGAAPSSNARIEPTVVPRLKSPMKNSSSLLNLGKMNPAPRTPWGGERASHLAGETMDVETGIESGDFLKSGSGVYLRSHRNFDLFHLNV
jgi:hypothetical protein